MEGVDAARVVHSELEGEEVREKEEATGRGQTSDQAEDDGDVRLQQNISHGPHCHATCQDRVLDVINVKFALNIGQGRHHKCGHYGGEYGGVSVHHGPLLWQS